MRSKPYNSVLFAGMILVLLAGHVLASSIPNRPTEAACNNAVTNLTWIQKAVIERYYPVDPNGTGVSCPNLAEIKAEVKEIIPHYVDTVQAVSGNFESYMRANSNVLPMLSVTGIAARFSLPTNYFDYTPLTMVADPEAMTNAYTVAGGPYLPPGRTNWLATDYQWQALTNVLRALVWTRGSMDWGGSTGLWGGNDANYVEWDAAKEAATGMWMYLDVGPWIELAGAFRYSMGYQYSAPPSNRWASLQNVYGYLMVEDMYTGIGHSVDVYYKVKAPEGNAAWNDGEGGTDWTAWGDPVWSTPVDTGTFDSNGVANLYTNITRIAQWPEGTYSESNQLIGAVGDDVTDPGMPAWCDAPSIYNSTARGWWSDRWRSVIKWDGPNGFQYK